MKSDKGGRRVELRPGDRSPSGAEKEGALLQADVPLQLRLGEGEGLRGEAAQPGQKGVPIEQTGFQRKDDEHSRPAQPGAGGGLSLPPPRQEHRQDAGSREQGGEKAEGLPPARAGQPAHDQGCAGQQKQGRPRRGGQPREHPPPALPCQPAAQGQDSERSAARQKDCRQPRQNTTHPVPSRRNPGRASRGAGPGILTAIIA